MKGRNTMILNQETVIEAVQALLNGMVFHDQRQRVLSLTARRTRHGWEYEVRVEDEKGFARAAAERKAATEASA